MTSQQQKGGIKLTDFVLRPSLGKAGKPTRVRTNFFEVTNLPDINVIHYDVTITPDVPPAINKRVYKHFEDQWLVSTKPVFDGRKNLFSPKPLSFDEGKKSEGKKSEAKDSDATNFDIILPEDDGMTSAKRAPRKFSIKLKKVGVITMEELHRFLQSKTAKTENCLTAIQVLDVLIRHQPSMKAAMADHRPKYVTVGRSFYTPEGSQALYGGVEVWQGYYQSVRPTQNKMMINIDLSATAFYESGNLVQMVVKLLGKRSADDLRRGIQDRDRVKIEKSLKNLKIKVTHRGEAVAKRRFKITKLTPKSAAETKFDQGENGVTDVASYFNKQYRIRLNHPYLPCVTVKKDMHYPMEVCEVVEGQRVLKKLNDRQTADMIKFTCQPPHMRANKIKQGLEILSYRSNEYLKQFGMSVSSEMAVVQARILPTPTLKYHPSSRDHTIVPRDGAWNLRDKKLAAGATLTSWSVVVFASEREQVVQNFVRELVNTCSETGMNVTNKQPPISIAGNQRDIENTLKQAWQKAGNAVKAQPQLIVCILPNTQTSLYASIKRVSDTILGVATQCIQSRHMMQAKKQYCANVCLKMNVKLGGYNVHLLPNQVPFISEKPTIVMGADVTHPSPGSVGRPSIAAVCGSLDPKTTKYSASIRIQAGRTEIIAELANMVKELLKNFYKASGKKPERILFYRDGVSEGQFEQVLEFEIKAIKEACKSLDSNYNPRVTFVVVQKRHHARFFPIDNKDAERSGNCLPGTVVESGITHPFEFDFYLQSHSGLQGTSRPCHYHVIYDENLFTPDSLQSLSYNLCYLYARCTRSVSLVTPVYYAHLVCSRARFHSRDDTFSEFSDSADDGIGAAASFSAVKPELARNSMYETHTTGLGVWLVTSVVKQELESFKIQHNLVKGTRFVKIAATPKESRIYRNFMKHFKLPSDQSKTNAGTAQSHTNLFYDTTFLKENNTPEFLFGTEIYHNVIIFVEAHNAMKWIDKSLRKAFSWNDRHVRFDNRFDPNDPKFKESPSTIVLIQNVYSVWIVLVASVLNWGIMCGNNTLNVAEMLIAISGFLTVADLFRINNAIEFENARKLWEDYYIKIESSNPYEAIANENWCVVYLKVSWMPTMLPRTILELCIEWDGPDHHNEYGTGVWMKDNVHQIE
ncbi:4978_t:CDS:10 [Ambispora leptoticha]|uniref:4978_t:CDS:1 n=1 Tax=Ambispora leptoticha TaxID=144679 RepID=A0A9N9GIJ4_9GLOM|nr:4978_t:CDS:10 [Ambispora leptoticha]